MSHNCSEGSFLHEKPQWVMDLETDAVNDPNIAELLAGTDGNPQAIRTKMKESLRQHAYHEPMDLVGENSYNTSEPKIIFRELEDPSNLWLWIQFENEPTARDKENFEEAIKAFFITGRLGGFNSLNLQVFYAGEIDISFFKYKTDDTDKKTPAYFHELGDIEYKGTWARFFLDIGTADELSVDILVNMLVGFSKEFVALSKIVLGGDNTNWSKPDIQSRNERLWSHVRQTSSSKHVFTNKEEEINSSYESTRSNFPS